MFEKFTDRARKIMQLANQEAQRFNHEDIGTEHILLGLVREGSGVGANVLMNLGADLRQVRLAVEKLVQSGPEMISMGKLPQTPHAKKVLEYAIEEALALHHNFVGSEHLLLGLMRVPEGLASHVLNNEMGFETDVVRTEVLNLLGSGVDVADSGVTKSRRSKLASKLRCDLIALQKSNPKRTNLPIEWMETTWVALARSKGNNVFFVGEHSRCQDHLQQMVEQLADQSAPFWFHDHSMYSLNMRKIVSDSKTELVELLKLAEDDGNVIFLIQQDPHSSQGKGGSGNGRPGNRGPGQFLRDYQHWIANPNINFALGGSRRRWERLLKHWPQIAEQFVPVELPNYDVAALRKRVSGIAEGLAATHRVRFSESAVDAAINYASEPAQAIGVLDSAAARKKLFSRIDIPEPVAEVDQQLNGLLTKRRRLISIDKGDRADSLNDEIERLQAKLVEGLAMLDLPEVTADDVEFEIANQYPRCDNSNDN